MNRPWERKEMSLANATSPTSILDHATLPISYGFETTPRGEGSDMDFII